MRILALDTNLDLPGVDTDEFRSTRSLYEYDVVFWDPARTLSTYGTSTPYGGLPRIADYESPRFAADVIRRNKEINSFLEMGRTFIVFLAPPQEAYYATGETKTSGTGRNQKVTTMVKKFDILDTIPMPFTLEAAHGSAIEPSDDGFRSVWRTDKEAWHYRSILSEHPGRVIANIQGTKKAVGAVSHTKHGGILLLLPEFYPVLEESEEEPEESGEAPTEARTEEEFTNEDSANDELTKDPALAALLEWIRSLRGGKEEALPSWAEEYKFTEEITLESELSQLEEQLQKIQEGIDSAKSRKATLDQWKLLFTGTGTALEEQAKEAFKILGFEVEDGPTGRSDIRLKRNGETAVVEVKGVGKSAAEKNAAQLEKWLSEERLDGTESPKGILLVNAWKSLPLTQRTEDSFPNQMIAFCTAREHCLITGLQLLAMVRRCLTDPSRKDEIAESLMRTVGMMPNWSELSDIFTNTEVEASAEQALPEVRAASTPVQDAPE
ncbi:hypothetical protein [Streptomyces sp. NPDC006855]|uniref:hypothetical protein n=1 Tax=Streptomyces sp. NPDC006855 TaxID=3364765 RepID=UPI00368A0606